MMENNGAVKELWRIWRLLGKSPKAPCRKGNRGAHKGLLLIDSYGNVCNEFKNVLKLTCPEWADGGRIKPNLVAICGVRVFCESGGNAAGEG